MKLFAVSDIHGHATIFQNALQKAGFDPQNADHLLVCCGDCFDRGSENRAVLEILNSIPNKVLIRGNHEDFLEQALWRKAISSVEVYNGTLTTLEEFFGADCVDKNGKLTMDASTQSMIEQFLRPMVDYFETEHYIFVHGWIPCNATRYFGGSTYFTAKENWRDATAKEWEMARWYNGMDAANQEVTEPNKTIICGHWHCSYGHAELEGKGSEIGKDADHSPYYGDGIIAIDACVAVSRKINCIVLED